jgi:phosphomannomutase
LKPLDSPIDLAPFIKAYDVRGLVGSQLTPEVVTALGAAFADEIGASEIGAATDVVVGHDMRDSSPEFAAAFAVGVQARGGNVVSIGLCSTDETYFASGHLNAPAAMFTASHNPATYNGIKFSRAGAQGISFDTGLKSIRDRAQQYLSTGVTPVETPGSFREVDVLADYAAPKGTPVALTTLGELFLPLDGVIDVAAERERIGKELAKVDSELQKVRAKLADENFAAKVPAKVLEEHQQRERDWAEKHAQLAKMLEALGA